MVYLSQAGDRTVSESMTNPLAALRTYVDLKDRAQVAAVFDECADAGLYLEELDDHLGVWIYRWEETDSQGKPWPHLFYINDSKMFGPILDLERTGFTGNIEDLEEHLLQWVIDEGCNPPGFAPEAPKGCPDSITCKHDIDVFVDYLFTTAKVAYHWDEMASTYVNAKQVRVFTPQASKHIDNLTAAALSLDAAYFQGVCLDMQRFMLKDS